MKGFFVEILSLCPFSCGWSEAEPFAESTNHYIFHPQKNIIFLYQSFIKLKIYNTSNRFNNTVVGPA
jgi:hypothetical protein